MKIKNKHKKLIIEGFGSKFGYKKIINVENMPFKMVKNIYKRQIEIPEVWVWVV